MSNESPQVHIPGRAKRNTAIGLAAGLLGGSAVGLLMTVPSFTNAAPDDATAIAAPVVALQDDIGGSTETERPEPGTRLRELLQQLVDDGTIDADQADAVTEFLVANRPERPDLGPRRDHGPFDGRRGHRPGFDGDVVAELLGIDADELRADLRDGMSIADVAAEQGVDVQTIIDAFVDEASAHLDQAVADERLTDEEAADLLAELTDRITARVNGERPAHDMPAPPPADG